jgi:hypothetical protein
VDSGRIAQCDPLATKPAQTGWWLRSFGYDN